ncbi:MAG: ABC transporter permease subunit [Anaerolineales bacterium]
MNNEKDLADRAQKWSEVFKNRLAVFSVSFMPILFTVIPLVILYSMRGSTDISGLEAEFGGMMEQMQAFCGPLEGLACTQFVLLQQFMVLFLLMPTIIPVTLASYSIVGEKTMRTLEPLLATPISTAQLLVGKMLAAAIPALLASLFSFSLFAAGTAFLAASPAVALRLFSPIWMIGIFVVGPLLSLAGVNLAVMISSRVNDPRTAEQFSALIILPVMAVFVGQLLGAVIVNQAFLLAIAGALIAVDAALIYFSTRLFQRETILTRWR